MELHIGTNIKRLRLEKGLTQEQLAALLCVSAAAVSKWEAKNTYPDITMLVPLAGVFGVRRGRAFGIRRGAGTGGGRQTSCGIPNALPERTLCAGARGSVDKARRAYPHDYRIMNAYMWDRAEGFAGNRPEVRAGAPGGIHTDLRLHSEWLRRRRTAFGCSEHESEAAARAGRHGRRACTFVAAARLGAQRRAEKGTAVREGYARIPPLEQAESLRTDRRHGEQAGPARMV